VEDKVAFELVSPERLLLSASVDMVVVPGVEGDFGVLPGHALFLSSVRPGVIEVHDKGQVTDRIFVSGGFAEATPDRCTVLADTAMPVSDLKRAEIEARIRDLREDVADAKDEAERRAAEGRLAVAEAMLAAAEA
jgi:F-type H+-transporting ATPase subunit epsilon